MYMSCITLQSLLRYQALNKSLLCSFIVIIIEALEAMGSGELGEMLIKTNLKGLMIKILIN